MGRLDCSAQCHAAGLASNHVGSHGASNRAHTGGGLDDDLIPLGLSSGRANVRGNPLAELRLATSDRDSLPGSGHRRLWFHGLWIVVQILQPDPGFQFRIHCAGMWCVSVILVFG